MTTPVTDLHPETAPRESGYLDVGDGNHIWWATAGVPGGTPALILHGGPGSGSAPIYQRLFDLGRFSVVLFDQRGAGRSRPSAAHPATDMSVNTTHHLIADIERLRRHLGVDRWLLFGVSWGSTLALAYAQEHPGRVSGVVLAAVTTTSMDEIDWLYRQMGEQLPDAWDRFRSGRPADHGIDLVKAYRDLLEDPDPGIRSGAAVAWCAWEDAVARAGTALPADPRYDDPHFAMSFARIVTHFFSNGAWLTDRPILAHLHRLDGIPAVLVHRVEDRAARIDVARAVASEWPDARLVEVPGAGHAISDEAMARAIIAAIDSLERG